MNLILVIGLIVGVSALVVALMNTYNFVRMFDLRGADANSVPDIYGNVERSVGLLHRNGESTIYAAAGQNLSFDSKGLMVPTGTVFVTSVNNDILIGR